MEGPGPASNVEPEINQENDMTTLFRQTLFILLCIAMMGNTACTSMQTVHASEQAVTASKIRVGDKVTLNYTDGSSEQIKVTDIGVEEISGTADDGRLIVANYDEVISLDHKEIEVLKTAGAAVGVVALGAILVAGAAAGTAIAVAGGL
jgi:hypothetical protein